MVLPPASGPHGPGTRGRAAKRLTWASSAWPPGVDLVDRPGRSVAFGITISAVGENVEGAVAALIAVAIVVLLLPVGHLLLVNKMNGSDQTQALMQKFGGLFVGTIGAQLMLSGLQQ